MGADGRADERTSGGGGGPVGEAGAVGGLMGGGLDLGAAAQPDPDLGAAPRPDPRAVRRLDLGAVPPPDPVAEPDAFVVLVGPALRIQFYDWGGPVGEARALLAAHGSTPPADPLARGVLLVHGLAGTAWTWAPVARRLRRRLRTVALDLRGHGGSDGPTGSYDPADLAEDVVAVAEGAGLLDGPSDRVLLAGHGFGAMVAAWAAAALGERCAGLVLVDGGWEDVAETTGLEPAELLRAMEEPPEVLRSMVAFLADRAGFDPPSWDADQERAARAAVVELPVGRVEFVARPHVLAACVEAMYVYRPAAVLSSVGGPVVALVSADDPDGRREAALTEADAARVAAGRSAIRRLRLGAGHNLMRYRPVEVAAAILDLAGALRSAVG